MVKLLYLAFGSRAIALLLPLVLGHPALGQEARNPTERDMISNGVEYLFYGNADTPFHAIIIDRAMAENELRVLAWQSEQDPNRMVLQPVANFAHQHAPQAVAAVNGYYWERENWILGIPENVGVRAIPQQGRPNDLLMLNGDGIRGPSADANIVAFAPSNGRRVRIRIMSADEWEQPDADPYRYYALGAGRRVLTDGRCNLDEPFVDEETGELVLDTRTALGYSNSKVVLLSSEHSRRGDQRYARMEDLCWFFELHSVTQAVALDGGSASQLVARRDNTLELQNPLTFRNRPFFGPGRQVANAIGVVPIVQENECGNFERVEAWPPRHGQLIKQAGADEIYYTTFREGRRHKLWIATWDDFTSLGFRNEDVKCVTAEQLSSLTPGPQVGGEGSFFHGAGDNSRTIYRVEAGRARPFSGPWDEEEFEGVTSFPFSAIFNRTTARFLERYRPLAERLGIWPPIEPPVAESPENGSSYASGIIQFDWRPLDNDGYRFGLEVCERNQDGSCDWGMARSCLPSGNGSTRREVRNIGETTEQMVVPAGDWCWRPWALGNDSAMSPEVLNWVPGTANYFTAVDEEGQLAGHRDCPQNCSENGTCNERDGTCACNEGYAGNACNRCADGYRDYPRCVPEPQCIDRDGDGYGEGCPPGPDCDDSSAARNPLAADVCGNGVDEDCDGADAECGCESQLGELVDNGGFECDLDHWTDEVHIDGGGDVSIDNEVRHRGLKSARLDIYRIQRDFQVQMPQLNLPVQREQNYELTFSARAAAPRGLTVQLGLPVDPWTTIGLYEQVLLGQNWDQYRIVFQASNTVNAKLAFAAGNQLPSVWIDDVSLRACGAANCAPCEANDDTCFGPEADIGCIDVDGDGYGEDCPRGPDCDDNDARRSPDASERCGNAVDDDCDGEVDEGFQVEQRCIEGSGVCRQEGVFICSPDRLSVVCNVQGGRPGLELCGNGLDDDCDTAIDEGFFEEGQACHVGRGACRSMGAVECRPDRLSTYCNAEPSAPQNELCGNDIDDDCDGDIDEGFEIGEVCAVGAGACGQQGRTICSPDRSQVICSAQPGQAAIELCGNGADDDCDGTVDEGFDNGQPCFNGLGVCRRDGRLVCSADRTNTVCNAAPERPGTELCENDLDDDCDGDVDEGYRTGQVCYQGIGACRSQGRVVCGEDRTSVVCDALAGAPRAEVCGNQIDEDCNGFDSECAEPNMVRFAVRNARPAPGEVICFSTIVPAAQTEVALQVGNVHYFETALHAARNFEFVFYVSDGPTCDEWKRDLWPTGFLITVNDTRIQRCLERSNSPNPNWNSLSAFVALDGSVRDTGDANRRCNFVESRPGFGTLFEIQNVMVNAGEQVCIATLSPHPGGMPMTPRAANTQVAEFAILEPSAVEFHIYKGDANCGWTEDVWPTEARVLVDGWLINRCSPRVGEPQWQSMFVQTGENGGDLGRQACPGPRGGLCQPFSIFLTPAAGRRLNGLVEWWPRIGEGGPIREAVPPAGGWLHSPHDYCSVTLAGHPGGWDGLDMDRSSAVGAGFLEKPLCDLPVSGFGAAHNGDCR